MTHSCAVPLLVCFLLAACTREAPSGPAPLRRPSGYDDARVSEVRYLALGDSFTIGTGSEPEQAFPERLAERWRARSTRVTLRNVAVNGYSTEDLIVHELGTAREFKPTIVTLAIGANDLVRGSTAEQYRSQLRRIFGILTNAGVQAASIVTLPQPDWSRAPAAKSLADPLTLVAGIESFNEILRDETLAAKALHVDLFPLMRRQARAAWFASDGLHPNARALDEWAGVIADRVPVTRP